MIIPKLEELQTSLHLPEKKCFTVEQANLLLPQIEEHILEVHRLLDALRLLLSIELEFNDEFLSHAKNIRYTKEYHKLYFTMYSHLDAIMSHGCYVKDIEKGLIDFYSKTKEGKEIFLCWRIGEKSIQDWHSLDAGFSERKGIEEL